MPTGYTSDIYEGREVSGKEFILKCARAFGATILMRDEPLDKEIPIFEPSDFYLKQLKRAKNELEEYKTMSIETAQRELDESYEKEVERYYTRMKEYDELEARYSKVIEEVKQWNPPTEEHINLKKYAIDQLEQSISHDCNQYYLKYPEKQDATKWLELMIFDTEDRIKRYQKEWDAEVKRTNERNQWIRELKKSFQ